MSEKARGFAQAHTQAEKHRSADQYQSCRIAGQSEDGRHLENGPMHFKGFGCTLPDPFTRAERYVPSDWAWVTSIRGRLAALSDVGRRNYRCEQ